MRSYRNDNGVKDAVRLVPEAVAHPVVIFEGRLMDAAGFRKDIQGPAFRAVQAKWAKLGGKLFGF
jgi:hypothetical protein